MLIGPLLILTYLALLKPISVQPEQRVANDPTDHYSDVFGTFLLCNFHFSVCP